MALEGALGKAQPLCDFFVELTVGDLSTERVTTLDNSRNLIPVKRKQLPNETSRPGLSRPPTSFELLRLQRGFHASRRGIRHWSASPVLQREAKSWPSRRTPTRSWRGRTRGGRRSRFQLGLPPGNYRFFVLENTTLQINTTTCSLRATPAFSALARTDSSI